jgi:predicted O-methyltransferase YrrM
MQMTPERWEYTCRYLREVFGAQDRHLANLMRDAVAAGLPDIAVSADVGRLLMILTSMTRGRLALEVGTLAGYSGIWIARGLKPGGRLLTIESEPAHAAFAREQFRTSGVEDRVSVREGKALDLLPQLVRELDPGSVDFVFLDAVKEEYPRYWELAKPLIGAGGLIVIDNILGGGCRPGGSSQGGWWIDSAGNPSREAAVKVSRMIANDPDFEAVAVPIREGVLIGRRMGPGTP